MRPHLLALTVVTLLACKNHRGNVEEPCNHDGSCNGPTLSCQYNGDYRCLPKRDESPARCAYESECFCTTCAEKCGPQGVKTCAYSDTSVWGAKPAVCECK